MSGPMDPAELQDVRDVLEDHDLLGPVDIASVSALLEAHDYHAAAAENNASIAVELADRLLADVDAMRTERDEALADARLDELERASGPG